ncbi:hypothetical protein [Stenotrophomonas maltophilia]|uniref:hypothetical protein n=1 Tax=Stenotrophomonas maltophilia TaxID=40324 RepID=UPI0039C44EB7
MRNLFLSAIAGALLLSAGCSSQPGAAALESEDAPTAVILLGEVNLPKGATLDDFPSLLNAVAPRTVEGAFSMPGVSLGRRFKKERFSSKAPSTVLGATAVHWP